MPEIAFVGSEFIKVVCARSNFLCVFMMDKGNYLEIERSINVVL